MWGRGPPEHTRVGLHKPTECLGSSTQSEATVWSRPGPALVRLGVGVTHIGPEPRNAGTVAVSSHLCGSNRCGMMARAGATTA